MQNLKNALLAGVAALAIIAVGAAIQAPQPAKAGELVNAIVTITNQANTITNQGVNQAVSSSNGSGQYLDVTATTAALGNVATASTDTAVGDCSCFDDVYAGIGQLAGQVNNMASQSVVASVSTTSTGGAAVSASAIAAGNIASNTANLSSGL